MTKYVGGEQLSDAEGTHRQNIQNAEMIRQTTRGMTQATATSADVTYFRTVVSSARTAGSNAGLEPALSALKGLTGGS
jgi:hypothetical protein